MNEDEQEWTVEKFSALDYVAKLQEVKDDLNVPSITTIRSSEGYLVLQRELAQWHKEVAGLTSDHIASLNLKELQARIELSTAYRGPNPPAASSLNKGPAVAEYSLVLEAMCPGFNVSEAHAQGLVESPEEEARR